MTQTFERSATVKTGVVPACNSWPGWISFSTTVPEIGERMMPSTARGTLAFPGIADHACIHANGLQRLQAGIAVGFGACGIGLGLLGLLGRDALMRQQILVQVGQFAGILGGDQRLAIGGNCAGIVG